MLPKAPHKLVESPRSALNRRTWTPWAEGVPIVVEGSQGRRMHLTLFCITDLCSAMKPCFDAFCTPVFSLLREILSAALDDDRLIERHPGVPAPCVSSSSARSKATQAPGANACGWALRGKTEFKGSSGPQPEAPRRSRQDARAPGRA